MDEFQRGKFGRGCSVVRDGGTGEGEMEDAGKGLEEVIGIGGG